MATLVAWLLRLVDYILNKGTKKGRISLSETRRSSKEILQLVQRQAFSEETDSLSEARPVKCQSKLANLLRVLTEGTLRVGGVIRHTSITLEAAHPTLLPNDHRVPSLNEILGHAVHEHVLSIKLQVPGLFKQDHCCTIFCESVSIITIETKRL